MKLHVRHIAFFLLIISVITGCIEPYNTPDIAEAPDFLVVDGFLNASENKVAVTLSRAVSISSADGFAPLEENGGIIVRLEDESGNFFPLSAIASGAYEATSLPINMDARYRLYISIPPDEEYVSDFVEVKQTPPVEKVFFDIDGANLRILVNTADPSGNTGFYRWTFSETFEYTSPYYSLFKIKDGKAVPRGLDEEIFRCYKSIPSTQIMIASSRENSSDVIRNFHIHSIPNYSQKLQLRYSINVKQFALSEDAYNYWFDLYKTTQNVGGLFDPMPGEVKGNFKSTKDPSRTVIGYFSGASVAEQRIFITPDMLPREFRTFRHAFCETDTILLAEIPFRSENTLLIIPVNAPNSTQVIGYQTSETTCIDCRAIHHGVTEKPDFWP